MIYLCFYFLNTRNVHSRSNSNPEVLSTRSANSFENTGLQIFLSAITKNIYLFLKILMSTHIEIEL